MTREEAIKYVQSCGEDEGPSSYEEAAEVFEAIYGRAPDADDGDQCEVWSLCCAAVCDEEPRTMAGMGRADMLAALAQAVGDDGTGDLGVIIDHAQPTDTVADLVEVVREARADAAAERAAAAAVTSDTAQRSGPWARRSRD